MSSNINNVSMNAEIIHRFACNPLTAFDNELKDDFIYAWSLPAHPTFENKMALIKAAIDEAVASPPHDCPRTLVFYFTHKIHQAVRERIKLYCLQVSASSAVTEFTGREDEELDTKELPPLMG